MTRRLLFALLPGIRMIAPACAERRMERPSFRWMAELERQRRFNPGTPPTLGVEVSFGGESPFILKAGVIPEQRFFIAAREMVITNVRVNVLDPTPAHPVLAVNGGTGVKTLKAGDRLSVSLI